MQRFVKQLLELWTPVGFGGIFKTLIERGFVDWIVTTGANVYHEDHFAWGLPVKQGDFSS